MAIKLFKYLKPSTVDTGKKLWDQKGGPLQQLKVLEKRKKLWDPKRGPLQQFKVMETRRKFWDQK